MAAQPGRTRWSSVAAGLVGALVWLVPTVALSDGPVEYLFALTQQATFVAAAYAPHSAGLGALAANVGTTPFALAWARGAAAELRAHDRELASRVAYVRGQLDPRHIAVLAREDYLLIRYYLPEYSALFHDPAPYVSAPRHKRVGQMAALVVFTKGLAPGRGTERK